MKMPPLLMALAVLFWGWRVDLLFWTIPIALALEVSRWMRGRWDLTLAELNRVWDLTTLLVVGEVILIFSSQDRIWGQMSFKFFQWLPFPLFPIMAAQAFGNYERMPMSVFWMFFRRHPENPWSRKTINISYIYFGICIVAASSTAREHVLFYPGIVLLIVMALAAIRPKRLSIFWWGILALLAASGGFVAQGGLRSLQTSLEASLIQWVTKYFRRDGADLRESRTSIGHPGNIHLSGRIVYRVTPEPLSPPPTYLREASYDSYGNGVWAATYHDLGNAQLDTNDTAMLMAPPKIRFAARISGYLRNGAGILAVPHGIYEMHDLPVITLLTNRLGVVRVEDGPSFVNFLALYGPGKTFDGAPILSDTNVPPTEREVIWKIAESLNLESKTDVEKIRIITEFFQREFTYSLSITGQHVDRSGKKTALGQFLTVARSGHCEYFATATALLLRSVGVPTRYATGYSVDEVSGKTYLVRARNAHAWVLAYRRDLGRWEDVDTTPASWHQIDGQKGSAWENVSDFFSRLFYEFNKWRASKTSYTVYMGWILGGLVLVLAWQIVFSRRRKRSAKPSGTAFSHVWPGLDSEFYLIDNQLARVGYERQPEEAYEEWAKRMSLPEVDSLISLHRLHQRLRFDPKGLNAQEREALRRGVQDWRSRNASFGQTKDSV